MVLILNKKEKESSNFNTIKIYENMSVCLVSKEKKRRKESILFLSIIGN